MIWILLVSVFILSHSQRHTATCDYEKIIDLAPNEEYLDHIRMNSTDIILTTNNLLLLDEDLNVLNRLPSPNKGQHECNRFAIHNLTNTLFVACQLNKSNPYFVVYLYINESTIEKFGDFQSVSTVNQPFKKFTIVGNTLLILQSTKIIFFTIVLQASEWYLKPTNYVLDKEFLGRTVNITDYDHKPFQQNSQTYYKIYVLDYGSGMLWVHALFKNNDLIPYSSGFQNYNDKQRQIFIQSLTETTSLYLIGQEDMCVYQYSYVSGKTTQLNKYWPYYSKQISDFKISGKVLAVPFQNSQKTVVTTLNRVTSQIQESDNNVGVAVDDNLLISINIDNWLLYYISGNRLVYRSAQDSLAICTLSGFDMEE